MAAAAVGEETEAMLIGWLTSTSISRFIMEPGVTEVTRAWSEARSSLCSYLSCYSISSMENTQLHFPSGVTLKVQDQESLLHTPGQHDVGGTTCVVTVWKSVPASGPVFVRSLCLGIRNTASARPFSLLMSIGNL